MNTTTLKCWKCSKSFNVPEDEFANHSCPNGCYDKETDDEVGSVDVMGSEIQKGDVYLVHEGELILVENTAEYLIEFLDALKKTAGEE